MDITLIIPYYRAPQMLQKQLDTVREYPGPVQVIVVDDCSPEPAEKVFTKKDKARLYRITTDLEWNREGARNLGATLANTNWIVQIDTDHILPVQCAEKLVQFFPGSTRWYRFPRFRVGKADETRKKDSIPDDCEYGPVKPHIDSYLCTTERYWKAGGYNEDYVGCLGGGSPFLKCMERVAGEPDLLPDDIYLEVHTRHSIPDASVNDLSRNTTEYRRKKRQIGNRKGKNPLRFNWTRIQ